MTLSALLKEIKLVVIDVDGTLTDGGMYYSAQGDSLKRFHVRDGMGIVLLQQAGIVVALMTTENSPIVSARAKKLKIEHVILNCQDKGSALKELCQSLQITLAQTAFIGDDINDEAALALAAVKVCPADATESIRHLCNYCCQKKGGQGAVREFAHLLLTAQNQSLKLGAV